MIAPIDGERRLANGTQTGAVAMSEDLEQTITKAIMGNELSDEEVGRAVRNAFTFLASCVDGQVEDIRLNERIAAANALLQYVTRRPDFLADVLGLAGESDVAAIASVLE
jgi:butyrate kinase